MRVSRPATNLKSHERSIVWDDSLLQTRGNAAVAGGNLAKKKKGGEISEKTTPQYTLLNTSKVAYK